MCFQMWRSSCCSFWVSQSFWTFLQTPFAVMPQICVFCCRFCCSVAVRSCKRSRLRSAPHCCSLRVLPVFLCVCRFAKSLQNILNDETDSDELKLCVLCSFLLLVFKLFLVLLIVETFFIQHWSLRLQSVSSWLKFLCFCVNVTFLNSNLLLFSILGSGSCRFLFLIKCDFFSFTCSHLSCCWCTMLFSVSLCSFVEMFFLIHAQLRERFGSVATFKWQEQVFV